MNSATTTHVIGRKLSSNPQQEKLTWQSATRLADDCSVSSTPAKVGEQRDATRQASDRRLSDCRVGHENGFKEGLLATTPELRYFSKVGSILLPLAFSLLTTGCSGSRTRLQKAAGSGDEIVEAEGTVPYRAEDLPGTQAAALAAAQRSAVEQVVGVYVDAKTRVDKAVAVENNILARVQGYVKKYYVLSEGRSGDWYKTRIRALVATQKIHEDLDSLGLLRRPAVGNPRVIVSLQEWIGENKNAGGEATRALTQGLLDRGFHVVDLPASANREEDPSEIAKSLSPGTAELLVAGLARAQDLGYGHKAFGGLESYRASVTFRVLEIGTGEVVTTVSQVASGLEGAREIAAGKALEKAAQAAAADLANLPQELEKRSHVLVTINGVTSFETLGDFQKSLVSRKGVKDQFLRSFSQASGTAVLDVHLEGISPQELADQCVKTGGPTWSIYQVAGRSIQLSASPAGR